MKIIKFINSKTLILDFKLKSINWKPLEARKKRPGALYEKIVQRIQNWRSGNLQPVGVSSLVSSSPNLVAEPIGFQVEDSISLQVGNPGESLQVNHPFGIQIKGDAEETTTESTKDCPTLSVGKTCPTIDSSSDKLDQILKIVTSNNKKITSLESAHLHVIEAIDWHTDQLIDVIEKIIHINDHLSNLFELMNSRDITKRVVPAKEGTPTQTLSSNQNIMKIETIKSP